MAHLFTSSFLNSYAAIVSILETNAINDKLFVLSRNVIPWLISIIADNPDQKIELKTFCAEIINDHKALELEQALYKDLPVIATIRQQAVLDNYIQIKKQVQEIIGIEIDRMMNTPQLAGLIIKKE